MSSVIASDQIQFSQFGQNLARKAIEENCSSKAASKAMRAALMDCFTSLAESPETTIDEKIIATFALNIQKNQRDKKIGAQMARTIMERIARSLSVPPRSTAESLTSTLAGIAVDLYSVAGYENTAQRADALRKAMDLISINAISPRERNVSGLGAVLIKENLVHETCNVARVLARPLILTGSAHLAEAVLLSTNIQPHLIGNFRETEKAASLAFDAIIENPSSSEGEKYCARFGKSITGECEDVKASVALSNSLLSSIARKSPTFTKQSIAKATLDAYPEMTFGWYEEKTLGTIMEKAFSALAKSPDMTEEEKRLIDTGKSMMEGISDKALPLYFAHFIMKWIAYPRETTLDNHIVNALLRGSLASRNPLELRKAYALVFRGIMSDPSIAPSLGRDKRKIAENIVGIAANFKDPGFSLECMQKLAHAYLGYGDGKFFSDSYTMVESVSDGHTSRGSSVIFDEDILSIDGIRLRMRPIR